MNNTHISFPSIEQFRNVIRTVQQRAAHNKFPVPTIKFLGTVKLHGTNAGVSQVVGKELHEAPVYAQSRSNVITRENDNAGFAAFVDDNRDLFNAVLADAQEAFSIQLGVEAKEKMKDTIVTVFGEWCGQGVQKGVAISQLPKMFVVFGMSLANIIPNEHGDHNQIWLRPIAVDHIINSYIQSGDWSPALRNAFAYDTFHIDIDFNNPQLVQNTLAKFTEEVERRCPVGAFHGVEGTGEGIVWKASYVLDQDYSHFKIDDLIFKVKGEKHSITRVKTLAAVDIEKVNNIKEFVDNVLTDQRLQQGLQSLKDQGLEVDSKNTGAFLKWIGSDVIKEESDTMEGNGLDRKEVMPVLNRNAREWFMRQV